MQGVTNYNMDIVGVKRQLPVSLDLARFQEIIKKVKQDSPAKVEHLQMIQDSPHPQIPPLLSSKPNDMSAEYTKSLLLLHQSVMTQRYLQLLTLNQFEQQQHQLEYHRSLLAMKRENSASSSNSISTCHSSPIKVPILIRGPPPSEQIPRLGDYSPQKKSKVSACKNYIALLCTGFARSILTANSGSDILNHLHDIMNIKRSKYPSLMERQDLQDYMLEHLYKDICGKRVKKMNKGRDFKVRNSEELELLLTPKEEDNDLVKFRKEVMKEMIDYFFVSKYYFEWLEKGMINQANRDFFMKNKAEIQRKFSNPTLYKPHFDYNSN